MSLKTWVSGVPSQVPSQVPRASKIPGLLAQWARWNSNIFRALFDILKFSMAARLRGHKQRKLNDHIYKEIHVEVIVYIFAHLHTTLRTEENLLGIH